MADPVTDGLRKPPSQRNPEFSAARHARALQTMAAGSLTGRVTNASLVPIASNAPIGGSSLITDMIFSHPGALVDNVWSPPYRIAVAHATLVSIHATLGAAGSTDTTMQVSKDGTVIALPVLTAGSSVVDVSLNVALALDDLIRVVVVTVGTDAQNLTIQGVTS